MRNLFLGAAAVALAASGALAQPQERGKGKDRAQVSAKAEARVNARANVRRDNRSERRVEARQERRVAARVDNRQERRTEARVKARQDRRTEARVEARQERRTEARGEARQQRRVAARVENRQERRVEARQEQRTQARVRARADDRRDNRQEARAEAQQRARLAERRADNRREQARSEARARARVAERRADNRREAIRDRREDWREDRRDNIRDARRDARRLADWRNDRRVIRERNRDYWNFARMDRNRGLINGCPPGLARKWNGCMPPGQIRARYSNNYRTNYGYEYRPRLFGLTNYYDDRYDGRYSYDDGYLYRLGSNGGIASYIPLLGGALAIGNPWPTSYRSYNVPDYYVDYYNLGGQDGYRYADNVLYRVDDDDAAITAIAALLTGNQINIGQQMPMGYDVYNVPYAYRDRYYDTPDAHYRYSDGYVYRVDPTTQLVAAAINLLTTGDGLALGQTMPNRFAVGQPMPIGYDVYNVPYGYRDRYYDTPEAHYRYSDNGYVYRIDPTTQLVTAAIELLV